MEMEMMVVWIREETRELDGGGRGGVERKQGGAKRSVGIKGDKGGAGRWSWVCGLFIRQGWGWG